MSQDDILLNAAVNELRGKSATAAMRLVRASKPDLTLHGLPGPLALMLAAPEGGWLDQPLLNRSGKPIASSRWVWQAALAKRYAGLAHVASSGPFAAAQVAFACLGFNRRIQNPNRHQRHERSVQTILDWSQAKEKVDVAAARVGLDSDEKILSTALEQLDGRWGAHTGRLAAQVACSVVPGASAREEHAWLVALSAMRKSNYHWNPGITGDRCLIRSAINAVGHRVGHPDHHRAPIDTQGWEEFMEVEAITEVLAQCWVIACQPKNPAVLVQHQRVGLAEEWGSALANHISRWPREALRFPCLATVLAWKGVESLVPIKERADAFCLSSRLPAAASSVPRPRM